MSEAYADTSTYLLKPRYAKSAGTKRLKINPVEEFCIRCAPSSDEHASTLSETERWPAQELITFVSANRISDRTSHVAKPARKEGASRLRVE